MNTCNNKLIDAGMLHPRTCAVCGLGPCHHRTVSKDITQNITCAFCGEGDFDAVGLKIHLTRGHCADFEGVEVAA